MDYTYKLAGRDSALPQSANLGLTQKEFSAQPRALLFGINTHFPQQKFLAILAFKPNNTSEPGGVSKISKSRWSPAFVVQCLLHGGALNARAEKIASWGRSVSVMFRFFTDRVEAFGVHVSKPKHS